MTKKKVTYVLCSQEQTEIPSHQRSWGSTHPHTNRKIYIGLGREVLLVFLVLVFSAYLICNSYHVLWSPVFHNSHWLRSLIAIITTRGRKLSVCVIIWRSVYQSNHITSTCSEGLGLLSKKEHGSKDSELTDLSTKTGTAVGQQISVTRSSTRGSILCGHMSVLTKHIFWV